MKENPHKYSRMDQWLAVVGASIPASIVLGVVVFEFFISIVGLVWLVKRLMLRVRLPDHVTRNMIFWPMVCWFAVVMLSRMVNGGSAYQFAHDFCFLRYPLFVAAMVDLSQRFPVHRYLMGGVIVGVIYSLLSLLSAYLIGFDFTGKPLERYLGKLNESAKISGLCAYSMPLLLLWAVFDEKLKNRKRAGILILSVISLALMMNSMVRTSLLASIFGLFGGFISQLFIRKKLRLPSILAITFLAGLGTWGTLWLQPSLNSMYDRVYYWQVSWELWLQNPIFGVGISSFKEAYLKVAESGVVPPFVAPTGKVYQELTPHHAHNLFLQLLTCSGLTGLFVFGWMYFRVIKTLRDFIASWQPGLHSWPFICLMIGLTGWNIYDPFYTTLVFYFLAMICVSKSTMAEMKSG